MKKLNISQVDAVFANRSYPIEFLLYYKDRLETKKIRTALKRLSSVFWPIFGEYDTGTIHFDEYSEKECFAEEVIDQEFDFRASHQSIYETYCQAIPLELKKQFFLKIIQYENGTVLIPRLNHLAGDGYSYFYFLSALAALYQVNDDSFKERIKLFTPHHQRTILKKFQFKKIECAPLPPVKTPTIVLEEVSRTSVREMIREVASNTGHRVSTNDILSAMVIKKTVGIQLTLFPENFRLTMPVDVRGQVKEYGLKFFGNALMFHETNFKTKDIKESHIPKLAIEIRKFMPDITKDSYIKYLNHLESIIAARQSDKLRPYDPEAGCLVTNLSLLPAHKLNFGTGNPHSIFLLTMGKNSAAILASQNNYQLRLVY